jgi:acyl-CoA synthetase (AMP-forming)/AMP-acid ligase II
MTETGSIATIAPTTAAPGGRKLPGPAGARGRDPDRRRRRAANDTGAPGELLVRRKGDGPAPRVFRRLFQEPEATEEAWAGGWFHTGDIVRREPDGSVFFVDRKKNVIRRSGENIAAVEVEAP